MKAGTEADAEPETGAGVPASRRTAARPGRRTAPSGKTTRRAGPAASGLGSQIGKVLTARTAQLRAAQPGIRDRAIRARAVGSSALAGARRLGPAKVAAALAAVVVLGLLIWWLTSLGATKQEASDSPRVPEVGASSAPAARGPLPLEGVSPLDFRLGDCFKDFDANAPTSTVVACDTGHSAQLVAVQSYAASDPYPGRDPLKQRALDACKAATLTEKSSNYMLNYKLAYPSSSSWGTGDRRVDCYVAADAGNVITESLLP